MVQSDYTTADELKFVKGMGLKPKTETETAVTEFNEVYKHLSRITGETVTQKTKVGSANSVYLRGDVKTPNLLIIILQFEPEKQCKIEYKKTTVMVPTATCMVVL